MARKRERFERSDVPRENPYRNLIALAVLLAIAGIGYLLVNMLWGRVKVEAHMGDPALLEAIDEQPGPTTLEGEFSYTDNFIEKILYLQVDDANAERPQLLSAQMLLIDELAGTAHLVDVPLSVRVSMEGQTLPFGDLAASYGLETAIPLLTEAYNLFANHVIIAQEAPWVSIVELDGVQPLQVVDAAGDFVGSIRTDLDASGLVEHGALFKTLNVLALELEQTPVTGATPEGEVPQMVSVDLVPFGIQTGILIPYSEGE